METEKLNDAWKYEPVPKCAVDLFRMMWQLESWLRLLVYVELRAVDNDWEAAIRRHVHNWPPASRERDRRLHHMATSHQAALSYLTFGDTWDVISDASNWQLFESYFPPKDNVFARVEEVKTIRNRIAHFREPHENDLARLKLFLADMERGLRLFCSRYTSRVYVENDALTQSLERIWHFAGYGIELWRPDDGWLYAPPPRTQEPIVNARLRVLQMQGRNGQPNSGMVYRLQISASGLKKLDAVYLLTATTALHQQVIHIIPTPMEVSLTIPAVLGVDRLVEVVTAFLRAGLDGATSHDGKRLEHIRASLPEYVLWPNHWLAFYDDNIEESIFDTQ